MTLYIVVSLDFSTIYCGIFWSRVMSIVESGLIRLAFRLRVVGNYEYRGQQSGISGKTQKQWLSLLLEDQDTQQLSISVPTEMIRDVFDMHLR